MRNVLAPVLAGLATGWMCGAADAATIAAHRAVYDLSLISSAPKANVADVDGRIAFEVQGSACEGWTVTFRMVDRIRPADGDIRTVDSQSTSFESGDGLMLNYNSKEYVNQRQSDEQRIKVERSARDAEGQGTLTGGDGKPFTVPPGALFPIQHQLKLQDEAAAGLGRDKSLVYDGSDGSTSYRVITFIGPRKDAGHNTRDIANSEAAPLKDFPSWPVSISYYKTTDDSIDTPTYQVGFDLYANGVATGLRLDYGDFVLGGELKKLELLKSEPCG
jgi:hypothetical protein